MIGGDIPRQAAEGEEPRVRFMPALAVADPIGDRNRPVIQGARTQS